MHNNKSNMTFEELGIRDDLLRGISELGFENPMPVQEKVIPRLLRSEEHTSELQSQR